MSFRVGVGVLRYQGLIFFSEGGLVQDLTRRV